MKKEQLPCYRCLKRPMCQSRTKIECSDLFFIILENADFDNGNRITNSFIKEIIKVLLPKVEHIIPEHDFRERLKDGDTLQRN